MFRTINITIVIRPLLTRILRRVSRLLGIPEVQHRLDIADSQLRYLTESQQDDPRLGVLERHLEHRVQQLLTDHAAHTEQQLTDHVAHLQQQLINLRHLLDEAQASLTVAATDHTEHVVGEMRSHLEKAMNTIKRDLDNIRRMTSNQSLTASPIGVSLPQTSTTIDDALYVSLEDHFRGDKDSIHDRQVQYVPYISGVVTSEFPLIDLGCGRGEWLKVLQENNIPARGIDSNSACVAECNENGLSASLDDLLTALTHLPDASCGAITMFQVLEHLPFDAVVNVLRESRRILIPNGVFIGEVPNSETLRVGASTFWIDPTHQRPLFPAVLAFLASSVGFSGVTGKYSSPLAPTPDLTGLPENASRTILELHHAINGPGDFALIATA